MPPSSSRTSTAPSRGPTTLPPYQPPTAPLNPTALLALQSLPQSHPVTSLSKRQTTAYTHLCDLAGEINDRYQTRAANAGKRRERRAAQGLSDDEDAEQKIKRMKDVTETMTTKMEAAVRRVVDERARVEAMETALQELDTNLRDGSGRLAPTQSTLGASQFRSQRRNQRSTDLDDSGSDDDSAQQEGPTAFLKRKLSTAETEHDALPARAKYAANNDYIAFRRILHDATHPGDDAPPLPHASTWFPSLNPATASSDDEDIQIASEKRSIRCPLTLLPMRSPLSSTKCPHAFEKEAILGMLAASELRLDSDGTTAAAAGRRRAGGGENAMRCPECQVLLTARCLVPDVALERKVKRVLSRERARGEEESEEEEGGSMLEKGVGRRVEGEGEEEGRRIKAERAASRAVSMVPNSQVGHVADEEEEDVVGETQLSADEEEE